MKCENVYANDSNFFNYFAVSPIFVTQPVNIMFFSKQFDVIQQPEIAQGLNFNRHLLKTIENCSSARSARRTIGIMGRKISEDLIGPAQPAHGLPFPDLITHNLVTWFRSTLPFCYCCSFRGYRGFGR